MERDRTGQSCVVIRRLQTHGSTCIPKGNTADGIICNRLGSSTAIQQTMSRWPNILNRWIIIYIARTIRNYTTPKSYSDFLPHPNPMEMTCGGGLNASLFVLWGIIVKAALQGRRVWTCCDIWFLATRVQVVRRPSVILFQLSRSFCWHNSGHS